MKTKPNNTDDVINHLRTGKPLETVSEFVEKQSLTKHERFIKYAGGRVATAGRAIALIGNCANTQSYEYSYEEQVRPAFQMLREELDKAEAKFLPKPKQRFGRNFFQKEE